LNRILVNKEIYDRDITKKFVKEITKKILEELNLDKVEVSITLTDNDKIRELNKNWRNKDKETDVLSFPINEKPLRYRYTVLGDVIISIPFAKRQAEEIGYSYKEEILRLLIHGILHLLGYDHEKDEKEAEIMFSLQDRIFNKLKGEI